jgi:hypothetical protein
MKAVVGVWGGMDIPDLLAPVGLPGDQQIPLFRITLKRLHRLGGIPCQALVPWEPAFGPLAADVKLWGYTLNRCPLEAIIAMRDLVAEYEADIGIMVWGTAATVELAEVHLAHARIQRGIATRPETLGATAYLPLAAVGYCSPRMVAYHANDWLLANEEGEWPPMMDARELSKLYAGQNFETKIPYLKVRAIWTPQHPSQSE